MIVAAILAILAFAMMTLFADQAKMNRSNNANSDFVGLKDQLNTVLRNVDVCTATLSAMTTAIADNPTTNSDVSFVLPSGIAGASTIAATQTFGPRLSFATVQIRGVTPVAGPNPNLRTATLYISVNKVGQVLGSSGFQPIQLPMYFNINAAKNGIASCEAFSPDSQVLCVAMGGTWDAAASPKCSMYPSCPAGQVMVSTGSSYNCTPVSSLLGSLCGAGLVPVSNGSSIDCMPYVAAAGPAAAAAAPTAAPTSPPTGLPVAAATPTPTATPASLPVAGPAATATPDPGGCYDYEAVLCYASGAWDTVAMGPFTSFAKCDASYTAHISKPKKCAGVSAPCSPVACP